MPNVYKAVLLWNLKCSSYNISNLHPKVLHEVRHRFYHSKIKLWYAGHYHVFRSTPWTCLRICTYEIHILCITRSMLRPLLTNPNLFPGHFTVLCSFQCEQITMNINMSLHTSMQKREYSHVFGYWFLRIVESHTLSSCLSMSLISVSLSSRIKL